MVRAIVGANWGDEGKGKITDMLASESDIVVRFQGGANAGKPIEGVYLAGVIVGGRHANCYMTPMGGMNHGFDVTFGKCAAEFLTEDNQ